MGLPKKHPELPKRTLDPKTNILSKEKMAINRKFPKGGPELPRARSQKRALGSPKGTGPEKETRG